MINQKYIEYLIFEVFSMPDDTRITFVDDEISISRDRFIYSEKTFEFKVIPDIQEMDALKTIHECDINPEISFLKLAHFFITEQYLKDPVNYDQHGRISGKNIQEQYLNILEFPVVDILKNKFYEKFDLNTKADKNLYLTTDLDFINLWGKLGFMRSIKRLTATFFTFDFSRFSKELRSFFSDHKKPEYNLILQDDLLDLDIPGIQVNKIAFWLVRCKNPEFDFKNKLDSPAMKKFIRILSGKNIRFGIHSAYGSSDSETEIRTETKIYLDIFGSMPHISRYHFLKYQYPDDLIFLEKNGICEDFSYCFTDSFYFRGGRTFPLRPWSFKENRVIRVHSFPITLMDVIFKYYLHLSLDEAKQAASEKIHRTLKFGTHCILLWHNNYLYKHYEKDNYQPELYQFVKNYLKNYYSKKDNS